MNDGLTTSCRSEKEADPEGSAFSRGTALLPSSKQLVRIGVVSWVGARVVSGPVISVISRPGAGHEARLRSDRNPITETIHLCLRDRGDLSWLYEMEGEDSLWRNEGLSTAGSRRSCNASCATDACSDCPTGAPASHCTNDGTYGTHPDGVIDGVNGFVGTDAGPLVRDDGKYLAAQRDLRQLEGELTATFEYARGLGID